MQNFLSSILNALASSLTPPFSTALIPLVLGLLFALPMLAVFVSPLVVGCRRADKLALLPVIVPGVSECELRGGLTLRARLGGVLMAASVLPGGPVVTAPRAGRGPWEVRGFARGSTMAGEAEAW